jgi:hypothetical protein
MKKQSKQKQSKLPARGGMKSGVIRNTAARMKAMMENLYPSIKPEDMMSTGEQIQLQWTFPLTESAGEAWAKRWNVAYPDRRIVYRGLPQGLMVKLVEAHRTPAGKLTFKYRRFGDLASLKDYMESDKGALKGKFRESVKVMRESDYNTTFDGGPVTGGTSNSFDEFTPQTGGPYFKQMYYSDYLRMHSRVFEQVNHNAFAKFAVSTITNFVMGRGVKFQAEDETVQILLDDWWKINEMTRRARVMCRDLSWQGELMNRWKSAPVDAKGAAALSRIREVDPSACWEVICNPNDIEEVYAYHFQYATPYNMFTDYAGKVPPMSYIIEQVKPDEIMHVKINVSSGEKRGRSDWVANLDNAKRVKDFVNAILIGAWMEANFLEDISIDGSDDDIQSYLNNPDNYNIPEPGSSRVHNKRVEHQFLESKKGAARSTEILKDMLGMLALGTNLPSSYMEVQAGGSNKASALTGVEPATKFLEERQLTLETEVFAPIAEHVIREAKRMGLLKPGVSEKVEFIWPELKQEDTKTKLANITLAHTEGAISHRTESNMIAAELKITSYDYEGEQAEIAKEPVPEPMITPEDNPASDGAEPVKTLSGEDKTAYKANARRK